MRALLPILAASVLALVAGLGLAWWWSGPQPQALPAFALPDLDGDIRQASDWDGDILVLNFWATWCKPCREEIPMLIAAQADYAGQGVQIIGLAVDEPEPVQRFANQFGVNYPLLVDALGVMRLQDAIGTATGLPFTVIVDRSGSIRAQVLGEMDRDRLDALLRPLLADAA